MKYRFLFCVLLCISFAACGDSSAQQPPFIENLAKEEIKEPKIYTPFRQGYGKNFNDLPECHKAAAEQNGIPPLASRSDTSKYVGKLVRIPQELEVFKVDQLTHSIPYLVPKASTLLADIGMAFRDSLISKKMPLYKPIVTSITRTDEDVKKLRRRNVNASENSVHCYATTFDISWSRYEKVDPVDEREIDTGRLKLILAQVLHDMRFHERCYVKHERKQACFHITVR